MPRPSLPGRTVSIALAAFVLVLATSTARTQDAPPHVLAALSQSCGLHPARGSDGLVGLAMGYRAHFTSSGMQFVPALGRSVPTTQHLALTPARAGRGGQAIVELPRTTQPAAHERTAVFAHGDGVRELYEVRPAGLELSWHFAQRPAGEGDLVVRYAVATTLPAPRVDGDGLAFTLAEGGGVRIGGVTGIDADGVRCSGATRWRDGQLELSLPAAFVDAARYPIVLDPTIGAILNVATNSFDPVSNVDVAYSPAFDLYLVAYQWDASATSHSARCQRVSGAGALVGTTEDLSNFWISDSREARLAYWAAEQRFVATWVENVQSTTQPYNVFVATLPADPASAASWELATIATGSNAPFRHPDIGCETNAASGSGRGCVVVFEDGLSIKSSRLYYTGPATLTASTPSTLFAGLATGNSYSSPAISRTASANGKLLVVARKHPLLGADQIVGAGVRTYPVVGGASTFVLATAASGETLTVPDVDGYDERWIAAWQRSGTTPSAVLVAPVTWGATPVLGAPLTIGGTTALSCSTPTIGYAISKSWLGYQRFSLLSGSQLTVVGIDSTTCTPGSDSFSVPATGSGVRIAVATTLSGGNASGDTALAAWAMGLAVDAQRLSGTANGGVVQNLGGGCGTQRGVPAFPANPAIGSNGFRCEITGLPPASATVFNFSSPGVPLTCGACVWTPFQVTQLVPTLAGTVIIAFPIPYLQSLVGIDFETQWTTLHPTSSPCSLVPNLVLSDRTRLVIGQ